MKRYLLLLTVLGAVGCAGELTVVAPTPPPQIVVGAPTKGVGCGIVLMGVIPAGVNGRAERAYRHALENAGGADGLVDTTVRDTWSWVFIGEKLCTIIEGKTYKVAPAAPPT